MKKVVLTGGIGSGKSTVAKVFEQFGVPVFYADTIAKELYNDPAVIENLASTVQAPIIKNGQVDINYLKSHLFKDASLKQQVESVIHPAVNKAYQGFCATYQTRVYTINEMALLFEKGREADFDFIISVIANEETRINRVCKRDGITRDAVLERIKLQTTDATRLSKSSFIIYNNNFTELYGQIEKIHKFLQFSQ